MLAGASTIDFVIFVIAADNGIMPQTIEHFEILKLLDIKRGIIVITKKDLVKKTILSRLLMMSTDSPAVHSYKMSRLSLFQM